MSYDLYFYKKKENSLTEKQVADYLQKNVPPNADSSEKQWVYENKETGVVFLIDWNQAETDAKAIKQFENFEEFENLHFSCSINFLRARFYGLEVFPVIEKLIHDLDLFVLNPQDEQNPDRPKKFQEGYLLSHWLSINDKISLAQFKELKLEYFPPGKSEYVWKYLTQRKQLQEKIGESIFVCGIFFIKSKLDNIIYTITTWNEHIPIIIPPVDYVLVQKKYKKLFKTVEEVGFVRYAKIMEDFKQYFKTYDHDLEGLKLMNPQDANKAISQFNNIKIECSAKDFGSLVRAGSFVNVRLD